MRALQQVALAAIIVATPLASDAKIKRSTAAKHAFQRQTPCPATYKPTGKCPGYIIDHIVPLCADGADAPSNMQWQTVADAKIKDREEWRMCRNLRH